MTLNRSLLPLFFTFNALQFQWICDTTYFHQMALKHHSKLIKPCNRPEHPPTWGNNTVEEKIDWIACFDFKVFKQQTRFVDSVYQRSFSLCYIFKLSLGVSLPRSPFPRTNTEQKVSQIFMRAWSGSRGPGRVGVRNNDSNAVMGLLVDKTCEDKETEGAPRWPETSSASRRPPRF